jgi:TRAP-type C4-dicarboxylate transport system permease small subunit
MRRFAEPRRAPVAAAANAIGTDLACRDHRPGLLPPTVLDKHGGAVCSSAHMLAKTLRATLDGLYRLAGYLAGLFLIAIFLLMMGLSIGREVGFNIPAGDDMASWCMAAMAFLALAHTFRSGELIRVGLLLDRLHGRARHLAEVGCLFIGSAFVGFFAWHAVLMTYDSWRFNDMAQGVLAVPLWIPQLGYSGGLAILFIAFADELVHVLGGKPPRFDKPPASAADAVDRAAHLGI